jgi:hypothetical protein
VRDTKECPYRRRERVFLGSEPLEFHSCILAGEGIMVNEVQCDECGIAALRESFDCRHMSPKKRFVSGGRSQECVSCSKKRVVLDRNRSACVTCLEKE